MKILWDNNESMSGLEILQQIKKKFQWEDSTVYTLIRRLVKKNFLLQQKKGVFYYSPAITENEYLQEQTQSFIDKVYGGSVQNLVSMLCKNKYLKSKDIENLRQFWDEMSDENE